MAVPKQKQSHSRTAKRRATHKVAVPGLVTVVVDGVPYRIPRRLVAAAKRGLIDPDTGRLRRRSATQAPDED